MTRWLPILALFGTPALAQDEAPQEDRAAAVDAFQTVHRVLVSPRCRNCHPAGDAPLQGDDVPHAHAMGVTRASPDSGLPCAACHREQPLTDPDPASPPATPHWALAPANQVFEGRTPAALCAQLNDPTKTGGRDLNALLHHVSEDPLVLWGWEPGPAHAPVPVPHAEFVSAFRTWVEAGGPCA